MTDRYIFCKKSYCSTDINVFWVAGWIGTVSRIRKMVFATAKKREKKSIGTKTINMWPIITARTRLVGGTFNVLPAFHVPPTRAARFSRAARTCCKRARKQVEHPIIGIKTWHNTYSFIVYNLKVLLLSSLSEWITFFHRFDNGF